MLRLLGYYITHTFVNCIKKLFRTWVAVFLGIVVACGLVGGIIGFTLGALLPDGADDFSFGEVEEEPEEVIDDEEWITDEDRPLLLSLLEVGAGAVILLILLSKIYGGDKSGSKIFTMSDVNFLFTAPLRPQSVLLFRVILQMGTLLLASLYLLFQLPNLLNAGMSLWGALALVVCWALTLLVSQMLSVLTYTLVAVHRRIRPFVRPLVFVLAALALSPIAYGIRVKGLDVLEALSWAYGAGGSRYIPVWGWLKGIVGFTLEGRVWPVLACIAGVLAATAGIVWLTWSLKADFYEDALGHAATQQEILAAAAERRTVKRRKDRADRLRRDGMRHGQGATALLHKAIYNRHRFARLGIVTGTGGTYFGVFLLCAACCRWLSEDGDPSGMLVIPATVVLVIAFFRNLGNPIEEEMARPYIFLLPDSAFRKLSCALLAGSYNTLLDVLPGLAVATLLLGASVWEALGWLLLIVTMDWMVSALGLLINMILPSSLPTQISAMLQLLLKMLVVLPAILLIVLGVVWNLIGATLTVAAINVALGLLCFVPAQALFHEGER